MLAPIAMPLAAKNKINPFLMGMVISHGALACAFSPINLYGAFINGLMDSTGVGANPLVLFALPFVLNLAIAIVLFLIYGLDLIGRRTPRPVEETSDGGGFGGSSRRPSGGVTPGNGPGGNTATLTDREVIEEALIHEA